MEMKRKMYDILLDWKETGSGRTAAFIDGARRVGKSYIVEKFAKEQYKTYILIDFYKVDQDIKDLFNAYLDRLDMLYMRLSVYYDVTLYERQSVIIFDEVQFCPAARAAIKYLVADGRYDFIETGSLVSIYKNVSGIQIPSEERHINMYPMDFEEFLWATGDETMMPMIRQCYETLTPMGNAIHRKAIELFRLYMIVGGMPQAVKEYLETGDFKAADLVKHDILNLYRQDIRKHAGPQSESAVEIFDLIPAELSRHDKKFKMKDLKEGSSFREFRAPFTWLSDAKVINCCFNTDDPNIGLKMTLNRKSMKCYFLDTGLLISHAFDENGTVSNELYKKLLFDKLTVNRGMLVENVVAQMLLAGGHRLYFYARSARTTTDRMEVDFLISKVKITSRHNISAIEVKSGKSYTLSSLNKYRTKFSEYVDRSIVIHDKDLKIENGILYLPYYMVCLL